jgi:hypothetical protein
MNIPQQIAIIRSVGGLVFDATFEETHQSELEVTDNPVETGVVVSDHAFMKPLRVTISAGVSDVLLNPRNADPFATGGSRSRQAFDLLKKLQASAEPFDVQTGLRLYQNMICTNIRTSQDKDTANVLVFEAELREVIIVSTQTVTYPPRKAGSTTRQGKAKTQKGEQQGSQVAETNKKQSILKKLVSALGGGS